MKILVSFLVFLGIAGGVTFYFLSGGTQKIVYISESPENRDLCVTIMASGVVEPEELINVGAQVSGKVLSFGVDLDGKNVDYGSEVDVGTTLALIDSSLMVADYKRSQANVNQCKAQIKIAKAQVASAEAQVTQAISSVEQSKLTKAQSEAQVSRAKADLDQVLAKEKLALNEYNRAQKLVEAGAVGVSSYQTTHTEYKTAVANVAVAKAALIEAETAVMNSQEIIRNMEAKLIQVRAQLEQSRGEVQLQESNLDAAIASFEREQQNVEYCFIKSPVRGIVIDRRVNIGQTVVSSMSASSLFLIAKDLRKMQVWVSVNEADIGRIHKGMSVEFSIDGFSDRVFKGTVGKIRLNASLSQNVVTYTVEVQTDNSDLTLLPYLTANVRFILNDVKSTQTVTNSALRWLPQSEMISPEFQSYLDSQFESNQGLLWVLREEKIEPLVVEIGLTDGIHTQVLTPLNPNDEFVLGVQLNSENLADQGDNPTSPFMPNMKRKKR